MTTVNDYNQLMKDFPLNDLLSATELDRIRVSLQAIFLHMRKIRPTKYPIQRALRLVEAISRDLSTQLLKVSRTLVKSAYPKNNFLISQPKDMLWVLKRTVSMSSFEHPKHMLKLMGKKIFTILRSKILFI